MFFVVFFFWGGGGGGGGGVVVVLPIELVSQGTVPGYGTMSRTLPQCVLWFISLIKADATANIQ